jgi:hypothetical protein
MGFIRVKGHGEHRYAYRVTAEWTRKGPRQKVSEYLGKVESPKKVREIQLTPEEISEMNYEKLILMLAENELASHGFEKKGEGMEISLGGKTIRAEISPKNTRIAHKKISGKEKACVLQINEGFLSGSTLSELINFRANASSGDDNFTSEPEEGEMLARLVVNAGLSVSQGVFLKIYEKCVGKNLGLTEQKD